MNARPPPPHPIVVLTSFRFSYSAQNLSAMLLGAMVALPLSLLLGKGESHWHVVS